MMFLFMILGILFLVAVVLVVRDIAHDGYRPIPTRPEEQEMLPRYR